MVNDNNYKCAKRVSGITVLANLVLAILKISAGIFGKSNAILADGVHSLSDIMSTIGALIGLKASKKPEDVEHPYGHEKLEPIVAMLLSGILLITALFIGYGGIMSIIHRHDIMPSRIAMYTAIISIITKEWMYRYTIRVAIKIDSTVLKSDAWHHRSDAFSSIAALIGIIGARYGIYVLDPIASIIVCVIIVKVAIEIYLKSVQQVIDESADQKTLEQIRRVCLNVPGVYLIDDLKTRKHGNRLYVDIEISVEASSSLKTAHDIAEKVHTSIEDSNSKIKHCTVHVNPAIIPCKD